MSYAHDEIRRLRAELAAKEAALAEARDIIRSMPYPETQGDKWRNRAAAWLERNPQ